jgi:hypothetical protein
MPLGSLGYCRSDVLVAEKAIKLFTKEYCAIMGAQRKDKGLPAYIQPPPNSVRWQPRGSLVIPIVPAGADQLVLQQTIPLGYDGILISISNIWNGTGFIEGSGDITWRLQIDQRYVPFFDSINTTLGSLTIPYDVTGQGIALLSGQTVYYYANFAVGSNARLNAGGQTLCACTGYIWPREVRTN